MANDQERCLLREPSRDLSKFREFLASIPLSKHREETKDIKWVEQNLPREILPLASIFRYYWEERRFLAFDDWFEEFWEEINSNPQSRSALEGFKKYHFNRSIEENGWFKRGFRARMYRTWVSLLTQLDFCYMFLASWRKDLFRIAREKSLESHIRREGYYAR